MDNAVNQRQISILHLIFDRLTVVSVFFKFVYVLVFLA